MFPPLSERRRRLLLLSTVLAGCLFCGTSSCYVYNAFFRTWEPQELQAKLWGMSPAEVRYTLGSPDQVHTSAVYNPATLQDAIWEYRDRVRDPKTGKADRRVLVIFRQGRVADLSFD